MKASRALHVPLALIGLLTLAGCGEDVSAGKPHTHDPHLEVTLCGLCGEVKGSDDCCTEDALVCDTCGKHKGSILCCSPAIHGVRDVILCRECGEVRFTGACCKEPAEECAKCGLHKDSPGCCKIHDLPIEDEEVVSHAHAGHGGHD